MTPFASWVEPVAQELRQTRAQIVSVARQPPDEDLWRLPSPVPGWRYRDLLAHLATGDWVCHTVLRAVLTNTPLDLGDTTSLDWLNDGNAQRVGERKTVPIDQLIAEVETQGKETQELLAQLKEEDETRTQEGAPMNLGDYLRGFPDHDRRHLAELKVMLENVML